jgi:hypothetical protein
MPGISHKRRMPLVVNQHEQILQIGHGTNAWTKAVKEKQAGLNVQASRHALINVAGWLVSKLHKPQTYQDVMIDLHWFAGPPQPL